MTERPYTPSEMDLRIARANHLLELMRRSKDGSYAQALKRFDEFREGELTLAELRSSGDAPVVLFAGMLELWQEIVTGEKLLIKNLGATLRTSGRDIKDTFVSGMRNTKITFMEDMEPVKGDLREMKDSLKELVATLAEPLAEAAKRVGFIKE